MKIVLLPEAQLYLEELAYILYYNQYFGTEESAQKYVDELLYDIGNHLPYLSKKEAPPTFNRYGEGMSYVTFRKNKNTHWYVFFSEYEVDGEIVYQIRHISNNYVTAQFL